MRNVTIHQSLLRDDLVLGGERDPVLYAGVLAVIIFVNGMSLSGTGLALAVWLASLTALRRMAKADPMMSRVWLRHIRQQRYYPAHSSPWVRDKAKKK